MARKNRLLGIVAALALISILVCALTACSTKLSGTYTNTNGLVKQSFTFKNNNKVYVSAFGIEVEGEYEIDGDEITITYSILGVRTDWGGSFKKSGNSIFINGQEFVKEK